ncbi:MAG TPA: phosphotransferase [Acidimicrobiales bacterium]|nr:phosphotransferase [Acidimicrobiales bacterium]
MSGVTLLGKGDWSKAFAFQRDGRDFVIRFGAYGEDFEMDREAATFAGPYLPIPTVHEVGTAFGGAFAISERRHGLFLEQLDLLSFQKLTPNLLRLFDALRDVPIDQGASASWPAKGDQHLTWREWLATSVEDDGNPRVGGWRSELAKDADIESLFVRGTSALNDRLVDCPNDLYLVHRDLLNRNVLVSFDAKRLEAVYDWGCSVYGDFLYDVAWFAFWAPWFPALDALGFRDVFIAHAKDVGLDLPQFEDRILCYELQIGLTHLAYNTVMKDPHERARVAKHTEDVLARRS